jgi:hypothetical protein
MRIFRYISFALLALLIVFFSIGLFTPEVSYTNRISIQASPEKSFTLFCDTSLMKEWMPGFTSVELKKGDGKSKGSEWRLVLTQDGQEFEMKETILEYRQGSNYHFLLENAVLRNTISMQFNKQNGNTDLVVNNNVEGNNIMWRSLFFFYKNRLSEQSMEMYDDLKTMIETN